MKIRYNLAPLTPKEHELIYGDGLTHDVPAPDWKRGGTQPKGKLGLLPLPNGKLVATKPDVFFVRDLIPKAFD